MSTQSSLLLPSCSAAGTGSGRSSLTLRRAGGRSATTRVRRELGTRCWSIFGVGPAQQGRSRSQGATSTAGVEPAGAGRQRGKRDTPPPHTHTHTHGPLYAWGTLIKTRLGHKCMLPPLSMLSRHQVQCAPRWHNCDIAHRGGAWGLKIGPCGASSASLECLDLGAWQ